ncbi:hypothetical protein DICVIV_01020 [Dictyocaulus viviparus]|uniref:Kinase D-interacting substrate of 220 kDa-like SAM domain-containing protein n=1 Tax=Dictyocaulus viviparus TaxID=29172 RepID=A0A0D8Y7J5_DICVI|nr:hypothetical protein DICVIV_01020 [Dictyocaulus viviparus]
MKLETVCSIVKKLNIEPGRLHSIIKKFRQLNLCGLVLASCPLQDLKDALAISLGDWTMIRLLVETLKAFGTNVPGMKIDKKKATALREVDEEESESLAELTRHDTVMQSPTNVMSLDQRRSLAISTEMNSDHKWLMETQTEGDLDLAPSSGGTSMRFGDALEDGLASDADSTESRFGSRESLLHSGPGPILNRHLSASNGRSELMRQIQHDSIHSVDGLPSPHSSLVSDDEHQMTIMRRDGAIALSTDCAQLTNMFCRENDKS